MKLPSLIPKFLTPHAPRPTPPPPHPRLPSEDNSSPIKNLNSKFKNPHPRSSVGKIARLPHAIRNQINHRLLNGKTGREILAWLNELPAVKEILAAQFNSAPVIPQNLAKWRRTGYQRWLKEQEPFSKMKNRSRYSLKISRAGRGLVQGAAAIASDQILQFLESSSGAKQSPADLAKLAYAVSTLLQADPTHVRFKFEKERIAQKDEQLLLTRDKDQRDVAAISLRVLNDDQCRAIAASKCDNSMKIELIGRRLYGKLWNARPVPIPQAAPKSDEGGLTHVNPKSTLINPNQP